MKVFGKKIPLKFHNFFFIQLCVFNFPTHCVSLQQLIFNQDKLPNHLSTAISETNNFFPFVLVTQRICIRLTLMGHGSHVKHVEVSVPLLSSSLS